MNFQFCIGSSSSCRGIVKWWNTVDEADAYVPPGHAAPTSAASAPSSGHEHDAVNNANDDHDEAAGPAKASPYDSAGVGLWERSVKSRADTRTENTTGAEPKDTTEEVASTTQGTETIPVPAEARRESVAMWV